MIPTALTELRLADGQRRNAGAGGRNGRQQRIFYFARAEKNGESLDSVPSGYSVGENQRTGLPFLTKAKS